jgi:hypothetical protein
MERKERGSDGWRDWAKTECLDELAAKRAVVVTA